ncbi:MAG: hypothetical protein KA388_02870 [Rhodocyclaceae bacterium]|nr:hypothetical protein [Rhodocyclaceae bacterium]MBK9623795.1 hypothetical protein [Rhodocyclaceae bacterium]MBL0075395.1 hypothetical protein [Rhodocyclaceae bacterium]MBP6108523.1 hypothetical protein [Rhodocyclaceae bacterium]MBP6278682.1 hypothetical protein [Rhodocyclaceae bacterium]
MKTLYRNTNVIAVAILCTMLLVAGTAVAVGHDRNVVQVTNRDATQPETIGRFVVTPTKTTFIVATKSNG